MRELARSFVPAADEVGRLQTGAEPDARLFQRLAEQGHYAGRTVPSTTRQGIYAAAPSGVLLASNNSREPEEVAAMLEQALARWKEMPAGERLLPAPPGEDVHHWEARYPDDGLVLHVVSRDVERESLPKGWRAAAWNQDFAWFTREEALALVPEASIGSRSVWPPAVATRLACCHLIDNVRGQAATFRAANVERAELESVVTAIDGERLELALSGKTRTAAKGKWAVDGFHDEKTPSEQTRGFEAELLGRATFDRAAGRFTRFELVAVGTRWGGTVYNGRGDDLAPALMGISFELAGTSPAEHVAPAHIRDYGWPPP